jgi:hypothetical protein
MHASHASIGGYFENGITFPALFMNETFPLPHVKFTISAERAIKSFYRLGLSEDYEPRSFPNSPKANLSPGLVPSSRVEADPVGS